MPLVANAYAEKDRITAGPAKQGADIRVCSARLGSSPPGLRAWMFLLSAYVCEHEDQRDPETKTSHQIPLWVGAV